MKNLRLVIFCLLFLSLLSSFAYYFYSFKSYKSKYMYSSLVIERMLKSNDSLVYRNKLLLKDNGILMHRADSIRLLISEKVIKSNSRKIKLIFK